MKRLSALILAAAAVSLAACDDDEKTDPNSQIGANPTLPEIHQYLFPPMHTAKIAVWKDGEAPTVPEGFKIEALASGLQHPRSLYVLPNGDILVSESKAPVSQPIKRPKDLVMGWVEKMATSAGHEGPGNRISILRENPDGHGTSLNNAFIEHLNSPFGVALVGNDLYVAQSGAILHFPYSEGQTRIDAEPTTLTQIPGGPIDHHWTKSLLASKDGTLLYVGIGSNSNITENGLDVEYRRADVLEVDVATGASRIYASGLRNPTGLQWEPATGKLWAIANERDEIGADLVPDYLTSVQEGGFYGWPYSYFGQHVDTRVMPQRPDLVAKAIKPDYAIGSHVAPLGLLITQTNALPAKYHDGAFISEHGSWDRSPLSGYAVVFVAFQNGKPVGVPQPVVTGFYSDDESELYGAPVGLVTDKDGALVVADDVGNAVWRVTSASP